MPTASSACGRSASSRFSTRRSGLADRNWKPRSRLASSAARSSARSGRPSSSAVRQRNRTSCSRRNSASFPFLRSRSSRSRRFSATPRSARMSSSSIVRTSRAGSTDPAGWGTDGSRNMRTTCRRALAVRNGATSSSACAPDFPPPVVAMSANSTVAGTCLRGLNRAVSRSSRSSGTREMPTLASALPPARGASRALVSNWKSAVRPVDGKPMSPARSMSRVVSVEAGGEDRSRPSAKSAHRSTRWQPSRVLRPFVRPAKIKRNPRGMCILRLTTHDSLSTIAVDFSGAKWSNSRAPGELHRQDR